MASDDRTVTVDGGRKPARAAQAPDRDRTGERVGRYELGEMLGAGGMGAVYSARDPDLDRTVALKLIDVGEGDRDGALAEARNAAAVSHPNVVAVHDVGWYRGELYIAMERVEGATLGEWLSEESRATEDVVRVFRQVATGLVAAHGAGVIHRDIKPGNILVSGDDEPRAQLADFGIAAGAGDAQRGGTPRYMAPEQKDGDSDARSDQYSFAVTLAEAMEKRSVPKRIARAIERATARDPGDRFPSMKPVADALTPARRGRAIAIAAAVVSAGLAGGAAMLLMGGDDDRCDNAGDEIAETWNDSRRDQMRVALAANSASFAATAAELAVTTLEERASQWSAMRRESCEATFVRGSQSETVLDHRTRCLDERAAEIDAVVRALSSSDTEISRVDEILQSIGAIESCGDTKQLGKQAPVPSEIADEVAAVRADLTAVRIQGTAGDESGALPKARALVKRADALGYEQLRAQTLLTTGLLEDRLRDPAAAKTLRAAAAAAARSGTTAIEVDAWVGLLSHVVEDRGKLGEGKGVLAALEAAVARGGDLPTDTASMLTWRGLLENRLGEFDNAGKSMERAVEILKKAEPDSIQLALTREMYSGHLAQLGRFDAALAQFELAEATLRPRLGRGHPTVLRMYENGGLLYADIGEYERSEKYLREVLAARDESVGGGRIYATTAANLARTLAFRDKIDEARALYAKALAVHSKEGGNPLGLATTLMDMTSQVLVRPEDGPQAKKNIERALKIRLGKLGADHPEVARTIYELGRWHVRFADDELAAIDHFRRARAVYEKALGPDSIEVSFCLADEGDSWLALNKPRKALAPLERALSIRRERKVSPLYLGETELMLAQALWATKTDRPRAEKLATSARKRFVDLKLDRKVKDVDNWIAER